jgi:hypothetical protein
MKRHAPHPHCIDPVVGAILSGWRYDISGLSPEMRTDYEQHLMDCVHCRSRQHLHRSIDVLLISVTTLSIFAFLLAVVVLHREDSLLHIERVRLQLHHSVVFISLQAVALAGVIFSTLLWLLVAITTPLPSLLTGLFEERASSEMHDSAHKNAA